MKRKRINWDKADWKQSSYDLAKQFDTQVSYVSRKRAELAPETLGQNIGKPKYKVNWKDVDWTKKNLELAEEIGCTPSLVSQNRKKFSDTSKTYSPRIIVR